jgi:hypothetical protein
LDQVILIWLSWPTLKISGISVRTGTLIIGLISSCSGVEETTTTFPVSVSCSVIVGNDEVATTVSGVELAKTVVGVVVAETEVDVA